MMKRYELALVLVVATFSSFLSVSEGSRILIANVYGTKSHQNTYVALTKELTRRGHTVTVITNSVNNELTQLENVVQILLESLVLDMSLYPPPFPQKRTLSQHYDWLKNFFQSFFAIQTKIARTTYGDHRVRQLMQEEQFDLVMFSEVCGLTCYPFGWIFKAPTILLSPNVLMPGRFSMLGDSEAYHYVPFIFSYYTNQMSLPQRILNVVVSKIYQYLAFDRNYQNVEAVFRQLIHPEVPSLTELSKNMSLVFANTHPVLNYARSLPPQVIEIGGIHCRPANPLPKNMEQFVSGSDDGFILFGMGSALKMEEMPGDIMQSFINVFRQLPHRIIWQWKGQVRGDLPANVLAVPWLPQQDLLGHPKCRGFLTHGGLNSLQEAVYHGVPVVGFPSGTDQTINIERAVSEGYALKLEWTEVTDERLDQTLRYLLYNSR